MTIIKATISLLLLTSILASISFKCAVLDGFTYFDFSGLASAAKHGDGKVYFSVSGGQSNSQLALCTEILPDCEKQNGQDMLVWGRKGGECEGFITEETAKETSATYGKVFLYPFSK